MALTRRQFLKRTGLATAGAVAVPSLFGSPLVRRAMANIGNKYLVSIFLDGGNDGLNTVTPVSNATGNLRDAYDAARGTIRLTGGMLAGTAIGTDANTGTALALHPGLEGLVRLQNNHDAVAIIQGCGYPDYSLSHEESRIFWESANRFGPQPNGWVGRHLMDEYNLSTVPAVAIRNTIPGEFRQIGTNVLAINSLNGFRFPTDNAYNSDRPAKNAAYQAIHAAAAASGQSLGEIVGSVGEITLEATVNFQSLHGDWNTERPLAIRDAYDTAIDGETGYGGGTANRLREISKLIYGREQSKPGVTANFFHLSNGGYDTHSDQGANQGQHYNLHRELGDSLELFYNDMVDLGVEDRVCVVVWSEFSRRIQQNESGTDHGSQGPMFVVGGGVNGGIYGNHPDIREPSTDNQGNSVYTQSNNPADPYVSTDMRDVFGTILKHWVGMTQGEVAALMPTDGDPDDAHYWNTANFDMGFLP